MLKLAIILCGLQLGAAALTEEVLSGCLQRVEQRIEGCEDAKKPFVWERPTRPRSVRHCRSSLDREERRRRSVEGMDILRDTAGERAGQWCKDAQRQKEQIRAVLQRAQSHYLEKLSEQPKTQKVVWRADGTLDQANSDVLECQNALRRAECAYRKAEEEEKEAKKLVQNIFQKAGV